MLRLRTGHLPGAVGSTKKSTRAIGLAAVADPSRRLREIAAGTLNKPAR